MALTSSIKNNIGARKFVVSGMQILSIEHKYSNSESFSFPVRSAGPTLVQNTIQVVGIRELFLVWSRNI
jgi:hypothetical protein